MRSFYSILALIFILSGCMNNSTNEIKKSDATMSLRTDFNWLKQNPSFQVEYQTGFSQNDTLIVPGDFYLVTNYSHENIMSFLNLSNSEICNLLTDVKTRTNSVLLLNQIHLIPNLENIDANRRDWDSTIVITQLPMWRKKYDCD